MEAPPITPAAHRRAGVAGRAGARRLRAAGWLSGTAVPASEVGGWGVARQLLRCGGGRSAGAEAECRGATAEGR